MTKPFNNQKVKTVFSTLKPWLLASLFVLILHFTGALTGISFFAQSALVKSGLVNSKPEENTIRGNFDYNFSIKDLKGNSIDFNQFKGKVIFLNLWATWCGPCRFEMPSIQSLYNSIDHEKIEFVMLSLDTKENHSKVVKYISNNQFTFPAYVTGEYVPEQLRVRSIPTTFIIARDGKIAAKKVGAAEYDTDEFREFLKELAK